MASMSHYKGATPVGTLSGAPWQNSIRKFYCDGTANAGAIHVGDLVEMTAGGYPDIYTAGTANVLGICVGIPVVNATDPFGADGVSTHTLTTGAVTDLPPGVNQLAATTAGYIYVATDPGLIVEMAEDGTGGTIALNAVGAGITVVAGTPSTTTGLSGMLLDSSSVATTATLPLQIIGLVNIPGNAIGTAWSATADHSRWTCRVNSMHYADGSTTPLI